MMQLVHKVSHKILRSRVFSNVNQSNLLVLPMPVLSPTVDKLELCKWNVSEGDKLDAYSIVCEIETANLTEVKEENQPKTVRLEVEVQEELTVAKLLCGEGDSITAGAPIAMVYDGTADDFSCINNEASLMNIDLEKSVYIENDLPLVMWQAYKK